MAIASTLSRLKTAPLARMVSSLLGTSDFHSHLRLAALYRFTAGRREPRAAILELGCGDGVVLIETATRIGAARAVGIEMDAASVERARRLAKVSRLDPASIEFRHDQAENLSSSELFDWILLLDVLEHLDDESAVLKPLSAILRPGGLVLVSVPTPLYPLVFGAEFHEGIGHVRPGYTLEQLRALFPGYTLEQHAYGAGPLTIPLCFAYYRVIVRLPRFLRSAVGFALAPLAKLDLWCPPSLSCSLFAVLRHDADWGDGSLEAQSS